jgi:hypothetical protein
MTGDLFSPAPAPAVAPPKPSGCPACAAWRADATSGEAISTCEHCQARLIARGPAAWRAVKGLTFVDLETQITRVFGADKVGAGTKLVWAWIERLGIGKRP